MPKEVTDVKKFLSLAKGDEKQSKDQEGKKETKKIVFIKESKKITKFKLRGKKYLYTFQTADKGKAQKLIASLPNNMTQNVNSKKVNLKKKKK